MKQRIIFSIVFFLCTLMCLESLVYTPQKRKEYIHNDNDIIREYYVSDSNLTEYELNEEGGLYISGEAPVLDFSTESMDSNYIAIRLTDVVSYHVLIQVYYDCGEGYTEANTVNVTVPTGSQYAYITIPENCSSFVIRTPGTISFEALELHEEQPDVCITGMDVNRLYVIIMFMLSAGFSVVIWFVDKRKNWSIRICTWFCENRKLIGKRVLVIVTFGILACVIEILLAKLVLSHFGFSDSFNYVTAIFIWSISLLAAYIYSCRNDIAERLENVVLVVMLLIGTTMMLVSPFAHTGWDVDTHYHMALQDSYIGDTWITQADMDIMTARYDFLSKGTRADNMNTITHMNNIYEYAVDVETSGFSLPHLPAGIAMAVGRNLHLPFYGIYLMGEFADLLVYSLLVYFAMRRLKGGKTILAIIALFPTNIFIACNLSYDYWVTGFSLLGMAYFIGELQREEQVTDKNAIVMCSSFALACVPKQIYVPLMIIPFLMPKKKIKNKKKYYGICILLIILLFASLMMKSVEQTSGPGDTRGSSAVDPSAQLTYIFSNLLHYLLQLGLYLKDYLSVTSSGQYIANFANLGYVGIGTTVYVVLLLIATVTDHEENLVKNTRWWLRGYMIVMYVGVAALIATAFYMVYTPVGADYIAGCQGRYLMPLLYPMFAVMASGRIKNQWDKSKYYRLVLYLCSMVIYIDMAYTMLIRRL